MRLLGDELAWPLFIYGDHLPQGNCTYFFIFSSPFWQPPFFFCKNVISTPVFIYLHLAALQKCQMGPLVLQPLAKQGSGPQTLPCLSKDGWFGDFPDGLVVKTLCFCCRGCGFDPWSDNWGPACCVVQPKKKKLLVWPFESYSCFWRICSHAWTLQKHMLTLSSPPPWGSFCSASHPLFMDCISELSLDFCFLLDKVFFSGFVLLLIFQRVE